MFIDDVCVIVKSVINVVHFLGCSSVLIRILMSVFVASL